MKINVGDIKKQPEMSREYKLTEMLPPVTLAGDTAAFAEPVRVQVTVANAGKNLLVEGRVTAEVLVTCGRCLESYTYTVDEPFREEYKQAGESRGADQENDGQEEQVRLFTGDTVDLTEPVLEAITLALPMKRICRETCRGLCPHCGRNLNEGDCDCREEALDPRLAVLADLMKRE